LQKSAKLPQNFKNAIKSQPLSAARIPMSGAKLPQNFKNAIKSQLMPPPYCFGNAQNYHKISKMQSNHNKKYFFEFFQLAQNYHKISKMQSNHNVFTDDDLADGRKITTKFQKCNQITTFKQYELQGLMRKITTKFQKCNQITTK